MKKLKYSIVARIFITLFGLLFAYDVAIGIQSFIDGQSSRIISILLHSFGTIIFLYAAITGSTPFGLFEESLFKSKNDDK